MTCYGEDNKSLIGNDLDQRLIEVRKYCQRRLKSELKYLIKTTQYNYVASKVYLRLFHVSG